MTLLIDGRKVALSAMQLCVFAALYNARGAMLSNGDVVKMIYAGRDGGPLHAKTCVQSFICALRFKLKETRFRIENNLTRGYRMVRV